MRSIGVGEVPAATDPDYDIAREFEDVAAALDAVAETSGCAVDVLGHSFGGHCAFGAATLTSNVRRLVLYEGWPPPDPDVTALESQVAARLVLGRLGPQLNPQRHRNHHRSSASWQTSPTVARTFESRNARWPPLRQGYDEVGAAVRAQRPRSAVHTFGEGTA